MTMAMMMVIGSSCLLGLVVDVGRLRIETNANRVQLALQNLDLLVVLGRIEHDQNQILWHWQDR